MAGRRHRRFRPVVRIGRCNDAHALHIAAGSDYADIMALASVGPDVVKFIAVGALFTALQWRAVAVAVAAAVIWVACAGWSIRSAVGFVAITFSDTAAKRGMTASSEKSIAAQIRAEAGTPSTGSTSRRRRSRGAS